MALGAWRLSGEERARGHPCSGGTSVWVGGAAWRGVSRGWCWHPRGQTKLPLQPCEVEESGLVAYGNSSSVCYCGGSGRGFSPKDVFGTGFPSV